MRRTVRKPFELDRLRDVLPVLVAAFVASHTYRRAERWDTGGDIAELYDAAAAWWSAGCCRSPR